MAKKTDTKTTKISWIKLAQYACIIFIIIGLALMYVMYDMKKTKEDLDLCRIKCEVQGYPRAGIHQQNGGCYCAEILGEFRPIGELKEPMVKTPSGIYDHKK